MKIQIEFDMSYSVCLTDVFVADSLRKFLQTNLYLVEFERLRVPQSYESFTQCNKTGLVRGLFRNHSHQQRVCTIQSSILLACNLSGCLSSLDLVHKNTFGPICVQIDQARMLHLTCSLLWVTLVTKSSRNNFFSINIF